MSAFPSELFEIVLAHLKPAKIVLLSTLYGTARRTLSSIVSRRLFLHIGYFGHAWEEEKQDLVWEATHYGTTPAFMDEMYAFGLAEEDAYFLAWVDSIAIAPACK